MKPKGAKAALREQAGEPRTTRLATLSAETLEPAASGHDAPPKPVCIVGIGASAGGLEALSALLSPLAVDTGMAFVVVSPLSIHEPSVVADLLAKCTTMPVRQATDGTPLEANHVYVMPPNTTGAYADGRLQLAACVPNAANMPIDVFLRSLAIVRRSRAVGVILSGAGSDGALGIQAIKAGGGIAFAQDARSAKFDGMPLAAIGTGCVDFMLPPEQIAVELGTLARRIGAAYRKEGTPLPDHQDQELERIFARLRATHEVDFTLYRHTTVKRRILRRMVLNKVQTLGEYLELLEERPVEVDALYQDILIKVTHFFRDPDTFEALRTQVFPALLKAHRGDTPIRIWVPGCSTGEEVYSIAISLLEVIGEQRAHVPFQIFATDVSEVALETARHGAYIENIAMDVSPDRLRRFFSRVGKLYQISKTIRDSCVFARQNLTRDPPFSRLDLVSCRNVLIYLEPVLQKRVIAIFHHALKPGGHLLLGTSETIGGLSELFATADKKNRIFNKNPATARAGFDFAASGRSLSDHPRSERSERSARSGGGAAERLTSVADAQKEADRLVLSRYAPAGVVINAELQIVQFRGHTGPYLEPAPGEASLGILKMAREGLVLELRAAIHKARRGDVAVRINGIRLRSDGQARLVSIEVLPLQAGPESTSRPEDRWFLVLFREEVQAPHAVARDLDGGFTGRGSRAQRAGARTRRKGGSEDTRSAVLERELAETKEYLQVTIEEQEATNEELQSANEELLSSNEELQSINEELEAAKEELQSTNEELTMLNEELGKRNIELSRLSNDLGNLLASVNMPIVMLSSDLRIRRFTPQAERVLNLIPSDVGRPVGDIRPKIETPDLEQLITEVIDTVSIRERDVQDAEGHWYSMRIRPYRTTDNKIDGAVILLVDIDRVRRAAVTSLPTHLEPPTPPAGAPSAKIDEERRPL